MQKVFCRVGLIVVLAASMAAAPALSWAAGGKLVLARDRDPEVYDPQRTTAISAGAVASLLYDTLLYVDYDLKTLTPGLARSWTISPDGKTYTFQLRNDVTFHSGRKLTAADVKFTFDRMLDSKTASPSKFRLADVEAVETMGDSTAVIRLANPRTDLLFQLTHPFLGIIDREAVEKYGAKYGTAGAGGTGPFSFVEWVSNDRLVFKRFDAYRWGPPFYKNRGPAQVEEVLIRTIPEPQTMVFELERGNVHAVYPVRPSDVDVLRKNKDIRIVEAKPNQQIQYLGFKVSRPGVSDIAVRKAISAAINKEEIVKEIQRGQGSVARGIFLPGTRDYWAGQESIFPRYNPEQAKAWLDAAGWKVGSDGIRAKDGQKLSLTFLGWVPEQEELSTLLQAQLKSVGIDVQVKQMAISAYFPGLRRADHELWSLDTPYPSILELMNFWFWSGNIPSPNRANWNDKRTDELLVMARGARTDEARAKAVQEIQKIMADNHLVVPIWHRALIVATRAELKDFRPHGVYSSGFYKLLDARLDK